MTCTIKRHDIAHGVGLGLMLAAATTVGACSETDDVNADPSPPVVLGEGQDADKPDTWACPEGAEGSPMVLIPTADGGAYCIDKRETLYSEYKVFLEAKGSDTSGQPDGCSWNTSFVPELVVEDDDVGGCGEYHWRIETEPDRPVNCMNFCNAWTYCQWAGKRLCGVRGADLDKVEPIEDQKAPVVATSIASEWFNACSQGGMSKYPYPYGDAYEAGACIDEAKVTAQGEDAKVVSNTARSTCRGTAPPYSEVVDLSGSLGEWVNVCYSYGCGVMGGAFHEDAADLSCSGSIGFSPKSNNNFANGIRCCADAVPAPNDTANRFVTEAR